MNELEIKDISQIIEDLEKENTIFRKIKGFFNWEKYHIGDRFIKSLKERSDDFFSIKNNLIYIFRRCRLPLILKIDAFISAYFKFEKEIINDSSELSNFIEEYIKTFENIEFEDEKFVRKYKIFSLILIKSIKQRIKTPLDRFLLVSCYISLLKKLFLLVKYNYLQKKQFISLFNFFDNIDPYFHNIDKWILLTEFYNNLEQDKAIVKKIIFLFLQDYKKDIMKELNFHNYYPDPIKFCEYLERKFKGEDIELLYNLYYEYFENNTTNFIPPLFLHKKNLENPRILRILIKILSQRNNDTKLLKQYFKKLISHKPQKENFLLYCEVIATFNNAFFPFSYIDLFQIKKLSLEQKYKLVNKVVKNPHSYNKKIYQPHRYLMEKKRNLKNEKLIKSYLELIETSENYFDYKIFYKKIHANNKKILNKFHRILNIPKFIILKKLKEIFDNGFYNPYKNNEFETIEDYVLKEFNSDSKNLIFFLFEDFNNLAKYNNNHFLVEKISKEYYSFKNKYKNDVNALKSFLFGLNDYEREEDYSIELNYFKSLNSSGNRLKLNEFINERIIIEKNKEFKNFIKLGILNYILGNFQEAYHLFQEGLTNIEKTKKANMYIDNISILDYLQEKQIKLEILSDLATFEINFINYGSIREIIRDLKNLFLKSLIKENYYFLPVGYFWIVEVLWHYENILYFLLMLNSYKGKKTEQTLDYLSHIRINTKFCIEWNEIVDLWEDFLKTSPKIPYLKVFSKRQFEILNKNPLFKGLKNFLKRSFRKDSDIDHLFNYELIVKKQYLNNNEQRILWKNVRNFLKKIEIEKLTDKKRGNKESIISKNLQRILSFNFELIQPKYPIGPAGKHIDLLINQTIPIEIKIFKSDALIDYSVGQLERDIEISDLKYGISFGIDTTKKKKIKKYYNDHVIGNDDNIAFVIK